MQLQSINMPFKKDIHQKYAILVRTHTFQLRVTYVNQNIDAAVSCQMPSLTKPAKSDRSRNFSNALFLQERCEVKFQITPLAEYTIIKHALAAVMKKNGYPSIAVNYGLFMPLYAYILCRGADKSLARPGRKQANVSVTMV